MAGILVGKLAIVTGAGSGIGRATCKILAREGASIIAADQNVNNVAGTMNCISNDRNVNHLSLNLDVGDMNSIKIALKSVLEHYKKPPSILVNCAGITRDNFLLSMSEADFDQVVNVNLKGTFMMIQAFSNSIIEHNLTGSIINIASIVGKYGNMGQVNYCASKAGVEALTKTAAKEFGKFGVRVNCVLPGFITTPMTEIVPDKVKNKFMAQIPLGRFGKAEEIAEVIAFLASERSSYIDGASIEVTGGF